jgi:hypothetical protein
MTEDALILSDGTTAYLVARDGGWTLEVDGVRQSHVGPPGKAPALATVRWMLAALGSERDSCAHLGGGLLALPRALADAGPGLRQVAVEREPAVAEAARTRFGLPPGLTLEVGDARAWLDAGTTAGWDAVVIDVFAGGRIPPAFTSQECFAGARSVLGDRGMLVLNSVAGPDLTFTRRELATLQMEFAHVAMIVQGSALKGLRFGNAVLLASMAPLDVNSIRERLADDPSRGALVTDVDPIVDGAAPARDADGVWSPVPDLPDLAGVRRLGDAARRVGETVRSALPRDS